MKRKTPAARTHGEGLETRHYQSRTNFMRNQPIICRHLIEPATCPACAQEQRDEEEAVRLPAMDYQTIDQWRRELDDWLAGMAEHTPGPWNLTEDMHGYYIRGHESEYYVCEIPEDDDKSGADARLIAAAPDLLAACEAALQWIRNNVPPPAHPNLHICGPESNCDSGCIEILETAKVLNQLSAAIAKGGPPCP